MSSSAAMQVLDDYAEMLGVLSSSQFTDDLQNKTVSLGASIDNSIATFNKGSGFRSETLSRESYAPEAAFGSATSRSAPSQRL